MTLAQRVLALLIADGDEAKSERRLKLVLALGFAVWVIAIFCFVHWVLTQL